MAFRSIALALALAMTTLPTLAVRAQPNEPSATDKETARQLMDIGDKKFESGDYAGALESYEGADRIMKVTSTGLAVGKAMMQLGRLIEARDKLIAVTRLPQATDESPVLTSAREEAKQLQQTLADRIPQLTVSLAGLPAGVEASVQIDNETVPPASVNLPRAVNPGSHTVSASAPGYSAAPQTLTLKEGDRQTLTLTFRATGEQHHEEPKDELEISPLVWVGVAFAGAGVIVGAITGGLSLSTASDVKSQCQGTRCPVSVEEEGDRALVLAHVSTASFAVAGAGAILAGVGLVLTFTSDDGADTALRIGPSFLGIRRSF